MTFIQRAFLTGANSGIGEALAKLLHSKHIKLILSGRDENRLSKIADLVQAEEIIVADLNQSTDRKRIIEAIQTFLPELVVNCAGFTFYGDCLSQAVEEQLSIFRVNALAPLEITLEAAHAFVKEGKKGIILNVSSLAGEFPTPGMAVYGGAKAFLTHFSSAFHTEMESKGIAVLSTCPGMVDTPFSERAAKKKTMQKGPVMSAELAAKEIWKQIEQKKVKRIIHGPYRLFSFLAKYFAPESFVKKIIWKRIRERL